MRRETCPTGEPAPARIASRQENPQSARNARIGKGRGSPGEQRSAVGFSVEPKPGRLDFSRQFGRLYSPVIRKTLLFFVLAGLLTTGLHAQGSRADTAARTASGLELTRATQAMDTSSAVSEAEFDLGEQHAVSARSGGLGAYFIGDTSLNYTSNATLANGGRQGDMYFVARGGAGIRPHITHGLYLDGYVSQEVFQYATYSSLNFSLFTAGGGLDYVIDELDQLTFYVRYNYQRYLDGDTLDEFFVNHAITAGVAKEFVLNDVMAIQTGAQAVISVAAEPYEARRNEYDLWLGWRWRIVEPLELQTYYMVSLFNYPDGGRVDLTQNVGGSLNLHLTRWARLSASAGFGANNSTDSFFDYTVVNLGGTLGLDFRF